MAQGKPRQVCNGVREPSVAQSRDGSQDGDPANHASSVGAERSRRRELALELMPAGCRCWDCDTGALSVERRGYPTYV